MKRYFIITIIYFVCGFTSFAQISESNHLKIANQAVINWLNNLNEANYSMCYEELSFELKNKTDSIEIIYMLESEVKSFGKFLGRKERSRQFASNPIEFDDRLSNYPDGYYAVFVFESIYENWELVNGHGTETVFLHQDYKSRWRILDWITDFQTSGEE